MKYSTLKYILLIPVLTLFNSCELDLVPYNDITAESLVATADGTKGMANGCLMMMKQQLTDDPRNMYVRHLFQLTEFPSDDVLIVKSTTDNLWYSFNFQHIPDQLNTSYLWYMGYKIILEANSIIDKVKIDESSNAELKQYVGEAYFYRAMVFFDMARIFSFPPSMGTDQPGILLRTSLTEEDNKARATVGDTYKQIISDLRKSTELMTMRNAGDLTEAKKYGNKWAAEGLLSRAYLFTEQYDSVVYYATDVIDNSPFQLEPRESYMASFWNTPQSKEDLFIIYYSNDEDVGEASLGSMYNGNGSGWGEVYPSQPYLDLISKYPEDIRNQFIDTVFNGSGNVSKYPGTTFSMLYMNKFSNQNGIPTLSSPAYIRLSELYLNRAEAYAHLSDDIDALADVNTIRARAGLTGNALVTSGNITSEHGYSSVLDAVLAERRLELSFEGQRRDDLMRNKIDLNRSYPSGQNVDGQTDIYPYNGPRQIYFIPLNEVIYNPLCKQND